jgi:hypothetical protein
MAFDILRLVANPDLHRRKILVMSGHDGGIVTFGKDLEEAFAVLVRERRGIASTCVEQQFSGA